MPSLLDKEPVRRAALKVTVDQYHAMGAAGVISERTELLRGVIVEKMGKSPLHSCACQIIHDLMLAIIPTGLQLRRGQPITLEDSEPEPDLALVEGGPADFLHRHPSSALLVVEVAVSSEDLDREKAAIYASGGIPEYWLVLPAERRVEVHLAPQNGAYTTVRPLGEAEALQPAALPGTSIPVRSILPP